MSGHKLLFIFDSLSLIMTTLISFVAISLTAFSFNFFNNDKRKPLFYGYLAALFISLIAMVCSNHVALFVASWTSSNILLTRMMHLHSPWQAARNSAHLARFTLLWGTFFLVAAFIGLYYVTGFSYIQDIVNITSPSWPLFFASTGIVITAFTQSAAWPFHKWLVSSLNSPTPVSALMHAGIINGGGFLLTRFAPLLLKQPILLSILFVVGLFTALLATIWKLIQTDIKRVLACSTMGQMGFMVAQCGLGLFPAAVAHLYWHGLFKAYLFLAADTEVMKKQTFNIQPPTIFELVKAGVCGLSGAYIFSFLMHIPFVSYTTTLFIVTLVALTATQFALTFIQEQRFSFIKIYIVTLCAATFYSTTVLSIETMLNPLNLWQPQPLNSIHCIGLLLLIGAWTAMLYKKILLKKYEHYFAQWYVYHLNASQSHKSTITTHHTSYKV